MKKKTFEFLEKKLQVRHIYICNIILKKNGEMLDIEFEEQVKKYLPYANSMNNLCNLLGLKGVKGYYVKIQKVIDKYSLSIEHFGKMVSQRKTRNKYTKMTNDEFFINGQRRNGKQILSRLIECGEKEYKCECCGLQEWNGKEISLQVHHINGEHNDNRIENLQILCPNCHSQTETYATRKNYRNDRVVADIEILKKSVTHVDDIEKCYCKNCGKVINIGMTFCSHECCSTYNTKCKVTPEKLIEDLKELKSFTAVGRKYGISDNAIKKKCRKYNILDEAYKYVTSRK